jgi:transcriptional regulator with XRE-family HTH domain
MGRSNRQAPLHLAAKLHAIRAQLGLTQEQMIERLGRAAKSLYPASISQYESGRREPPLTVLLQYAREAGVPVDILIDDDQDLPHPLPSLTGKQLVLKLTSAPARRN